MDPRTNPYAPGAGARPPSVTGRDDLLETVDIALDRRLAGRHTADVVLVGVRGVGKTVLLNRLHATAKAKGYETVKFEVPDGSGGHLAPALVPALNAVLRRLDRRAKAEDMLNRATAALQNFAAVFRVKYEGISVGADPAAPLADSGAMESDLPELLCAVAEAAQARQTGLALFVDELQYLSLAELRGLSRASHDAAQEGLPYLLIAAGLPESTALIAELKSYAERLFDFPEVGPLPEDAARAALTEPAAEQDVSFDPAALDRILAETACYPYFLQVWGKFVWDTAEQSPITKDDVARAGVDIMAYLDQHFFRARLEQCTEAEQHYLRAMAELGPGAHKSGAIAAAMGVTSDRVAGLRKSLIENGLVYSPGYGEAAFTVPLFDDFMRRIEPELKPYEPRRTRK